MGVVEAVDGVDGRAAGPGFALGVGREREVEKAADLVVFFVGGELVLELIPAQAELGEIAQALYPLPKPKGKPKTTGMGVPKPPKDKDLTKREEAEAALRSRQLRAATVNTGGQARGFLYFDLRRASLDVEKSIVYVPEVAVVPGGQALFYFEISLKPYAK